MQGIFLFLYGSIQGICFRPLRLRTKANNVFPWLRFMLHENDVPNNHQTTSAVLSQAGRHADEDPLHSKQQLHTSRRWCYCTIISHVAFSKSRYNNATPNGHTKSKTTTYQFPTLFNDESGAPEIRATTTAVEGNRDHGEKYTPLCPCVRLRCVWRSNGKSVASRIDQKVDFSRISGEMAHHQPHL